MSQLIDSYSEIRDLDTTDQIFDLTNKVGVIAGGCGKLGLQFAKVLAQAGAHVVLIDRDVPDKNIFDDSLKDFSDRIMCAMCDVTDQEQVQKTFEDIDNRFDRLDFFIGNVMAKPEGYYDNIMEYTPEAWRKVIDANLTGTFFCCQEASAHMQRSSNGGSIVLLGSIYGIVGPDQRIYGECSADSNIYDSNSRLNAPVSYSASKGALNSLAKHMATSLGESQIRVNTLIPGGIYDHQESKFHEAYIGKTILNRMAVWSDFNGAILFLVSDASRYMTGAELVIDGGWTAW